MISGGIEMKKHLIWLLLAALLLSGCGREPDRHPEWDASWLRFENHLAAETPEGFELREQNDILPVVGLFHSSWSAGEGRSNPDATRSSATVYDAQLELLLSEEDDEKDAKSSISSWLTNEKQNYKVGDKIKWKNGEQNYQIYPLLEPKEDSSYIHGAVAFAACGSSAICAQLLCSDAFEGDAVEVLESFLTTVYFGEN